MLLHPQNLGILVNARIPRLRIPYDKSKCLVNILLATWSNQRERFTLRELSSLFGLATNLALATQQVKHTFVTLQCAELLTIKLNLNTAFQWQFKTLTDLLTSKNIIIKNFCLSKAYKTSWYSSEQFNIAKPMCDELCLLTSGVKLLTAFLWVITIRNIIPKSWN